jgi:glycosyltransferase involved in cell wall biosynthesis
MGRVAVLTSHLTNGDAVSNDVLGMLYAFLRRGYEARIYAGGWDFEQPKVYDVSEIRRFLTRADDLLIYHHSIGWGPGLELLQNRKYRAAIKYHNITPPQFFVGISPWHEEKCRLGILELQHIVDLGCDLYLADSEFNQYDLLSNGVEEEDCFVVPPFHHIERLQQTEPDLEILDRYRDSSTNILMVGRIAPHKSHPALIEAFAAYHYDYNRKSRLLIIGKEEAAFESYSRQLREFIEFIGLEGAVSLTGGATDSALKSYYLLSHAFAIASEHEGFCVPAVEAMSMKVPVVAYASSALTATIDGAGIVLRERQPYLMAEALDRLIGDESLSFNMGQMAWRRYDQNFTNERIEAALFRALGQ